MAELADAHDSGSCGESRAGSSPVIRINFNILHIALYNQIIGKLL